MRVCSQSILISIFLSYILWYTGLVAEIYKRHPNTQCSICNTAIYKRPSQLKGGCQKVFCSTACFGISCRKEVPCVICGKLILSSANKKTCSRGCANKNRTGIQYKINSPRDKVNSQKALKIRLLEVRGKNCERCKYNNYRILQIHHKDRNRNNNSLENLELICPNCHCEEHYVQNMSYLKYY